MDHDRASGEGVRPQEYTLIKLQLVDPPAIDARFGAFPLPIFLLAATLRPETMVGQTNYWIKPGVQYEVARARNGAELWVCGARSLRNLAQDYTESFDSLFQIQSDLLLGAEVTHPAISVAIRGLPLLEITMSKGTGIVTSVPSDAPADYQGIIDLQKIPEMRAKYGISEEWVRSGSGSRTAAMRRTTQTSTSLS
jgi:leucyl-tRNA synthetase